MKQIITNSTERNPRVWIYLSRWLSALLTICLLCALSACNGNGKVSALEGEALAIDSFANPEVTQISVLRGTQKDDIALPATITGYIVTESTVVLEPADAGSIEGQTQTTTQLEPVDVPVTWSCEGYAPDTDGDYAFVSQLSENYSFAGDMPQITVHVKSEEPEPTATILPVEVDLSDAARAEPTPTPDPSATPDAAASASPEPTATLPPEAYQITAFVNDPIAVEVARGTAMEAIPFPATLKATNVLGAEVEVPVTWVNTTTEGDGFSADPNDYAAGSVYGYGPWGFTAMVDPAYTYAGAAVMASVSIPVCYQISNFSGVTKGGLLIRFVVAEGEDVSMPEEVGACMEDGGYWSIPVTWSGEYNTNQAGTYTLKMHTGDGYSGGGSITGEIVIVQANER